MTGQERRERVTAGCWPLRHAAGPATTPPKQQKTTFEQSVYIHICLYSYMYISKVMQPQNANIELPE